MNVVGFITIHSIMPDQVCVVSFYSMILMTVSGAPLDDDNILVLGWKWNIHHFSVLVP